MDTAAELRHARWLVSHLTRDREGRLTIAPASFDIVSQHIRRALLDQKERKSFLDQTLRLAHGAWTHGGELDFARLIVSLILIHLPEAEPQT